MSTVVANIYIVALGVVGFWWKFWSYFKMEYYRLVCKISTNGNMDWNMFYEYKVKFGGDNYDWIVSIKVEHLTKMGI